MFSFSGYGIVSGGTVYPCKRTLFLIPDIYEYMGKTYDSMPDQPSPDAISWDFSLFQPDVVVINLGTNDSTWCLDYSDRKQFFADEYKSFLKVVRDHNPGSMIFCVLGLMGNHLFKSVCDAVQQYSDETGDKRVTTVELPDHDREHFCCNYHPGEACHEKAAQVLTSAIRKTMEW